MFSLGRLLAAILFIHGIRVSVTQFDPGLHQGRRERFLAELGSAAAVIPAASLVTHHADCEWPFRQQSDFFYLTGFDEPDAVALLLPASAGG